MNLIRGFPSENRHGNSVGTVQISFHLRLQVVKRVETQGIVKTFLVVAMAPFHFPVMPRSPRPNQLVLNVVFVAKHIQRMYAVCFRGMCKLRPVICLQNVRSVTEEFNCSFEKIHCGEAALLFIRVDKSIPRRFFYDRYIDRISARLFRNNKHLARISHPFATFRRGLSVHRIRRYAWIFSLWIPVSS